MEAAGSQQLVSCRVLHDWSAAALSLTMIGICVTKILSALVVFWGDVFGQVSENLQKRESGTIILAV
jgi:hypothetical protein